jgi:glutathione synthase/RimK-type ligase-like ATP-grasp enzyme
MILIITEKQDGHVGAVSPHLDAADAPWVRMNTEDLPTNAMFAMSPAEGAGLIRLRDSGKHIDIQDVQSVWYRKPAPPTFTHLALDEAAKDYVEAEFNEILHGTYAILRDALWINDPFTTRISHRKMLQLHIAQKVGFTVPKTLVTNDAAEALRFADAIGTDLAIKSLGALSVAQEVGDESVQYGVFTRRLTRGELEEFQDKIGCLPTQFQEFIEKRSELRITCVGKEDVFACRIEPEPGQEFPDDSRFNISSLKHVACSCPELLPMLHGYMEAFGLNFGCFDVAIRKTGEPVFLECNPNGQWLWVERITGLPIAKAIANELMSSPPKKKGTPPPLTAKDLQLLSASLSNEDFRRFCKNRNHARH